jgi:hypothetical protein
MVTGTLHPFVGSHLPNVAHWVQTWTAYSRPMRLFVIRSQCNLLMRYEQWILHSPTRRVERVLAYRTRPEGVRACCRRPAFWKIPKGERGCPSHILRLVAMHTFHVHWRQMTGRLAKSNKSSFAQLLMRDTIMKHIFEWCFCNPDCLSCSCGECTLQQLRAGVMCPKDVSYWYCPLSGPDSPRKHCEPLRPENDTVAWFVPIDGQLFQLT